MIVNGRGETAIEGAVVPVGVVSERDERREKQEKRRREKAIQSARILRNGRGEKTSL